jgi:hypothetical protein
VNLWLQTVGFIRPLVTANGPKCVGERVLRRPANGVRRIPRYPLRLASATAGYLGQEDRYFRGGWQRRRVPQMKKKNCEIS